MLTEVLTKIVKGCVCRVACCWLLGESSCRVFHVLSEYVHACPVRTGGHFGRVRTMWGCVCVCVCGIFSNGSIKGQPS